MESARPGDLAMSHHIPLELRKHYVPEVVLGRGAFGCVVQARRKEGGQCVAIKLVVPWRGGKFEEQEMRHLRLEAGALELMTSVKCPNGVQLIGKRAIRVTADLSWFITELLRGESLNVVIHGGCRGGGQTCSGSRSNDCGDETPEARSNDDRRFKVDAGLSNVSTSATGTTPAAVTGHGPLRDLECIKVARSVLAALNVHHSVAPHRVTVYCDVHRLVRGQDWEEGFSRGLLNSLSMLPLLSYGATAPLAALPGAADRQQAVDIGWGERPCGRTRLMGREDDPDDKVLKEFAIAGALLERCDAGDFFQVQGGGAKYPARAAVACQGSGIWAFSPRQGPPAGGGCQTRSVAAVVQGLTSLQGCQLWVQAVDLAGVELHKDQLAIVGSGIAGPPVDLRPPGGMAAAILA